MPACRAPFFLLIFLCLTASAPAAFALPPTGNVQKLVENPLTIKTKAGDIPFTVEIAVTPEEQQLGLMNRRSIGDFHGMLFPSAEEKEMKMWMKDTLIPLDMLFIAKTGEIVYIAEKVPPLSLDVVTCRVPVTAVLELKGGAAKKNGIHIGDHVIHPLFEP